LNQSTTEQRPTIVVRHAIVRNTGLGESPSSSTTSIHEPIVSKKPANNSSYILQTTSFPDKTDTKVDKKIHRCNNVVTERVEVIRPISRTRNSPLRSTNSTGFQIMNLNTEQQQTQSPTFSPIHEQKQINAREDSPLPIAENPIFDKLPPKKPPRTFHHENRYDHVTKTNDQKVPSSSSSNNTSPTFDLGMRESFI
jgi:hypothetical protein